jgi:peptidoglycan/xylan/chitin deacetylase (PgdA/CDA1 family)
MLHGLGPIPPHIAAVERPYWISEAAFAFTVAQAKVHAARLTFDDGNDTDTRIALPKLTDAGLTAAFFIPSDRIGQPGYVRDEDIRALHAAGMEIGSHGCAHLNWLAASDAEIASDVTRSIDRLAQIINAPVRSVAIPYGRCDRRVLGVLHRIGIGRVHSSFRGPDSGAAWLVRRDCIMADMGPGEIAAIIAREPDVATAALNLLRVWRRTGAAAFRAA